MKKSIRFIVLLLIIFATLNTPVMASDNTQTSSQEQTKPLRVITLHLDGTPSTFVTNKETIGEFFEEINFTLAENDLCVPSLDTLIYQELHIFVTRSIPITFRIYEGEFYQQVYEYVNPTTRVASAIGAYSLKTGVSYEYDLDNWGSPVEPGMIINLYPIREENFQRTELIPYYTEIIESDTLEKGAVEVMVKGEDGFVTITEKISYRGGIEQGRSFVSEVMTKPPVNEIIFVGIKEPVTIEEPEEIVVEPVIIVGTKEIVNEPVEDNSQEENTQPNGEVIISTYNNAPPVMPVETTYNNPQNPVIDGLYFEYSKEILMSATAYTNDYASTGKTSDHKWFGITASGLPSQVGVVAVDPNVIPLWTKLYIEGYGFAIAGDTGKSVKGNIIDLFFDTSQEVRKFGRQTRRVFILSDQDIEIAIRYN